MSQTRVHLAGSHWSPDICFIVLGGAVSGGQALVGTMAARALFYAEVMEFACKPSEDAAGALLHISADATLPQAIMIRAATEIMGHFGRGPAQSLIWRRSMILSRAASQVWAAQHAAPTTLRSATSRDHVETLDAAIPHDGFFLTRSYQLRHQQFDGTSTDTLTREVFVATDAALVLPYDPARDRVMLVEQFRMGPFGRGDPTPWVLEPVAGRIDAGETPHQTARRECLEEADLTLQRLDHINSHYCSPGCSTEVFHCYLGLCDLPDTGRSHGGLETEAEDIRRHVLDFSQAMELMQTGEINIGPLYMMLLWLERERPRLRASA